MVDTPLGRLVHNTGTCAHTLTSRLTLCGAAVSGKHCASSQHGVFNVMITQRIRHHMRGCCCCFTIPPPLVTPLLVVLSSPSSHPSQLSSQPPCRWYPAVLQVTDLVEGEIAAAPCEVPRLALLCLICNLYPSRPFHTTPYNPFTTPMH